MSSRPAGALLPAPLPRSAVRETPTTGPGGWARRSVATTSSMPQAAAANAGNQAGTRHSRPFAAFSSRRNSSEAARMARESVPLHAGVADALQLSALKDFSSGIVRRVQDDRLRRRTEGRRQFLGVERPIGWTQFHETRRRTRQN